LEGKVISAVALAMPMLEKEREAERAELEVERAQLRADYKVKMKKQVEKWQSAADFHWEARVRCHLSGGFPLTNIEVCCCLYGVYDVPIEGWFEGWY